MRQFLSLAAADLMGIDDIEAAVLYCGAECSDSDVGQNHSRIGEILLLNAETFFVDEDIVNLQKFARCVACELLAKDISDATFRGGCWSFEPPAIKIGEKNGTTSDIRSIEKKMIAMTMILVLHLRRDPRFLLGANALVEYQERHHLWTSDDAIDCD